ncbi:MAG: YlxR family protein [Propionibacteriaceae bacterium]|nr:YlxR family protein [Propionibacteriaceae bacterium]
MGEPTRTCIGCREVVPAAQLRRYVLERAGESPGQPALVTPDLQRRLPGRGAYLHADRPECLAKAQRKRAFARAFRQQVDTSRLLA